MCAHGALEIDGQSQLEQLTKVPSSWRSAPPGRHGTMNKEFIGKNASVLLKPRSASTAGDEMRLVLAEVDRDDPLVFSEQMMPIMPLVRVEMRTRGSISPSRRSTGSGTPPSCTPRTWTT